MGFNAFHYYSTENESNWFDEGQWGGGAGYEMFEWDKLTMKLRSAIETYDQVDLVQWVYLEGIINGVSCGKRNLVIYDI